MAAIEDVIAYIAEKYPHKHELSNARVTKLVYLSDWKHSLESGRQITGINWYFDNYGPFVWDVKEAAERHPELFDLSYNTNMFGSKKLMFKLKDDSYSPSLTEQEKAAVDHVIEVTRGLYWNDFIKLVYSTYPVTSSDRYSLLDLPAKAREYQSARSESA